MRKNRIWAKCAAAGMMICAAGASSGAEVGIYAPAPDGGKVVGEAAIRNTLAAANINAADFARMSLDNLLQFRVVIIPNTRAVAQNEDQRWRDNLRAYVTECGGAIIFNHDAIGAERSPFGQLPLFPEIVKPGSVERAAGAEVTVAIPDALNADFDYLPDRTAGQTVAHMYSDHFMFEAAGGTPLLADPACGKTVAAAGAVGKGRVVMNGMFGGNPNGLAAQLEGIDREILVNTVKWCLAGKGLAVTNAAQAKVAEWRPDVPGMTKSLNLVAVLGNADYDIKHRARTKIEWAGLAHDFIPLHFLNIRDLSADDYKLLIFFAPLAWEEGNVPDAVFDKFTKYINAGGKAIIFLRGSIGRKTETLLLKLTGSKPQGKPVRDNPDNLRAVQWTDAGGNALQIKETPENWFTSLTEPAADGVTALGYWLDDQGARKSPAIVKMPFGYIANLNIYGDHRLFTANAAVELLPELGPDIFKHLSETRALTQAQMGVVELSPAGQTLRAQAEKSRQAAEAAAADGKYTDANRLMLQSEAELVKAYAVSMPSVPGEERIAWTHARGLPDPETICARLARAGFTGIAVTHLEGHYPSPLYEPLDPADKTDWMQKWIDTAHRNGLKIGPGFSTFLIHAGPAIYDRAVAEDWRVVPGGMVGKTPKPFRKTPRLDICRSRPEVADYAIAKSLEIMRQYPVDYVFYDYIRWSETCYCDYCREKFQQDTGLQTVKWPDDAMGKYQQAYNDWRARPVTRVVRTTAENIAGINPKIKFGVATFRGRQESWGKAQYWWEWTNDVDYIMPMTYVPDNRKIEDWFVEVNNLLPPAGKARLAACLAPPGEKGGSDLTRLQQLDLQRKYAPAGVMYFWYHGLTDAYLELLQMGPWRNHPAQKD